MNSQVCVNCSNKKAVNKTDNRLVTESCGHVKCMDCLLREKTGCAACKRTLSKKEAIVDSLETEVSTEPVNNCADKNEGVEHKDLPKEEQIKLEELNNKIKIPHIKVIKVGNKKYYNCTLCNKNFNARSHISYHEYCDGKKKPYCCPTCKKSFITLSHYNYHMRVHNQKRLFTCDICNTSFYQVSKLKRHKLKHTNERKYTCDACSKAFCELSALRTHMRTHTDERPYECPNCPRRFRDSSNFRKHVNKHKRVCHLCGDELPVAKGEPHRCGGGGGPRQHACPHCPKTFERRKDMCRHAVTHSDSKPFRCKACPEERRFKRKDNIERHIRSAHSHCTLSDALECDLSALQSIATFDAKTAENNERILLEIRNPLPPLPPEVLERHIDKDEAEDRGREDDKVVDKKSIIEANIARESVIVEKRTEGEKKPIGGEKEYVHKIRKAIIPLPPIDQEKFRSVQRGHLPNNVNSAPITSNVEIYKKILYEKAEKDPAEVIQNPKMHWRRKMEQDIK